MATDKWLQFGNVEMVNLSRTLQLAEVMGLDSVWLTPESVDWIEQARAEDNYEVIANAPWYDADYAASSEFAGIIPLSFPGLSDSSAEASVEEYITDGGRSGRLRNSTLPIVASVALVGSSDRGVEYGKRWLDRLLRVATGRSGTSGADLRYYRYAGAEAPVAHHRQVRLTRGTSVTRQRSTECSVTWLVTFTLTCDDPFEYSDPIPVLSGLGGVTPPTGDVVGSGTLALTEQSCPVYDYTPIYDPLYPALVAAPAPPNVKPDGWRIEDGMTFTRFWARVDPPQPSHLNVVPVLTLTTDTDARAVRVSVWDSESSIDDQCEPLFSAVVSYLPAGDQFVIDGERSSCYVWDGFSTYVRRADSLVYSPEATPVEWGSFNDPDRLMLTLDIFDEGSGVEGDGDVRLAASFVTKSD